MKHLLVILDGALDEPLPELNGKTPLWAATGEHLKAMTRRGRVGVVRPLPPDWTGDPEAALVSLLGYPPRDHFTGRGPLDAAALEVDLDRTDTAFRFHFVHTDGRALLDPTAGGLPPEEGRLLAIHVEETLRHRTIRFYPAEGYRHVLVWRNGPDGLACTSPYEAAGKPLGAAFPTGDRAEELASVMWDTAEILADHRINRRRRDRGLPTADLVWPWSPGRAVRFASFGSRHGVGGACVAGNPMVRGLARSVGLRVMDVPGATGSVDTDYVQKARAALSALQEFSFVLVHVEAPNEAGLAGDWEAKTDALRRVDQRLFGTLLDRLGLLDDFRILVAVDHATPVRERRAVPGPVPFLLSGNRIPPQTVGILPFDERAVDDAEWRVDEGWNLLDVLWE